MERICTATYGEIFWQMGMVGKRTTLEYLHSFIYEMVVYYTDTGYLDCSLFMPKV